MLSTLIGSRLPQKYRKYFKLPKQPESWKIAATGDTALGRAATSWLASRDKPCGVFRLDLGLDALGIRLGLIEHAERTIDIQSYLISDDLSGNLVAMKLVDAADRGVRVRLLMDDALTEPIDAGLITLDQHPYISVRVFNPFPRRRSRFIALIAYFNILNRRMHNKSFTVDNQVTIVGGRNLADEYYQTGGEQEFLDEDILAIGPVVDAVSDGFDEYWNTPEAIPISVFDDSISREPFDVMLAEGRDFLRRNEDSPYLSQVTTTLIDQFLRGDLPLTPADVDLVLDEPDKVRKIIKRPTSRATEYLLDMVTSAVDEVIVVSPYFVPQKAGVRYFASLVAKGVRVIIITNSLASTNHSSVHAAYARYRKPLLKVGVELYELRPRFSSIDHSRRIKQTLHSKVAVVDHGKLFVGSFNLDPRSLYINTEMGIAVSSRNLARTMASSIMETLPRHAYRLSLGSKGKLEWHYNTRSGKRTETREPNASRWRRFSTWLMSFLPIESQM